MPAANAAGVLRTFNNARITSTTVTRTESIPTNSRHSIKDPGGAPQPLMYQDIDRPERSQAVDRTSEPISSNASPQPQPDSHGAKTHEGSSKSKQW
ncbi:hypothetical protein VKT23_006489 [Stygiomarasmius scandens]|uniref:Uncharacterized protein n=1 Tax=Marasmiellus scandens TaxID=2682957 RepID=A0ABR1JU94_9AGAR